MAEVKTRVFALLALVVFGALIFGCIQTKTAAKCSQYQDTAQKEQCINYMAVWYQDPYACYDIKDISLREKCLDAAVEPKEAQKLKSASMAPANTTVIDVAKENNQNQAVAEIDNAAVSKCVDEKKTGLDGCMQSVAIETKDMTLCAKIKSEEYRMPCITNVAVVLKNPQICSMFEDANEKGLCNYYSGGK